MENLALYLAIIGWFYLYVLNNRSLKRAEIGRLKDQVINQTLEDSAWLIIYLDNLIKKLEFIAVKEKNVELHYNNSKSFLLEKSMECEYIWTTKLTQIELKINLLNKLAKVELVNIDKISALREIDFSHTFPSERDLVDLTADLIEEIESNYHYQFFDLNIFEALVTRHRASASGALFGFIILISYYHTMSLFFFNF